MKLEKYDNVIHLSHNDLDGYGCQYLLSLVNIKNVSYLNTSYHDVNKNMNIVFEKLLENKSNKNLVLITDVNLDEKTATKINNFKLGNKHLDYDLILIDHHKTGYEVSLKNENWYKLNTNRCASYLVGQWLIDNNDLDNDLIEYIKFVMEFIDSHDRWLDTHKYHHKANIVSEYIFNKIVYPSFLEEVKREHLLNFLDISFKFFINEENTIYDYENNDKIFLLKFLEGKIDNTLLKNKNISFSNKLIVFFTEMYEQIETPTYKINLDKDTEYTFKLFYELDSNIFQYLTHNYMDKEKNKDVNFLLNVKRKGSCSFRSKNDIDVGSLAFKYFNGGGHPNASGGSIPLESKSINDIVEYLKNTFNVSILEKNDNFEIKEL